MFKINFDADKPMRAAEGILLGALIGSVFWLAVFYFLSVYL